MGYLFENMEPMDIQAERRNTAQAIAERDAAYGERDMAYGERDAAIAEAEKWKRIALAAEGKEDALVGV